MIDQIAEAIFAICVSNSKFKSETECHEAYVNCVITKDAASVKDQDYLFCVRALEIQGLRKPAVVWEGILNVK